MRNLITHPGSFVAAGRLGLIAAVVSVHLFALPASPAAVRQDQPAAELLESLRLRIAAHLGQARFAPAAWGVKIVSLDTSVTVFDYNSDKYFSPASNAKLYTAALALDQLGPNHRIKTSLYASSRPDAGGTLRSDLIAYGRGDPTFAARINQGDYYKSLEPLVTALINAGVRRIEGDLIADESFFRGPRFGSGWEWDDLQWYYGAEVSALSINDNSLDLFVRPAERAGLPCRISTGPATSFVTLINRTQTVKKGGESRISVHRPVGENIIYVSGQLPLEGTGYTGYVAVSNPAGLFISLLRDLLAQRGVKVSGRLRTMDWKYRQVTPIDHSKLVELGSVESPPLGFIVGEMMKPSQNLWAQLLLLQVGAASETKAALENSVDDDRAQKEAAAASQADPARESVGMSRQWEGGVHQTTESIGLSLMNGFLGRVGVRPGEVLLEEGSGLSRKDLVTPGATVELLRFMSRHRWGDVFRQSMPIAGVDGTLRNRMKDTEAAGNVRAKTGTLRYVHALSGYVTTGAGERLAFSIMLNNYYNSARSNSPREEVDVIATMLAGWKGLTRPPDPVQ